jgi:hypothetical protein
MSAAAFSVVPAGAEGEEVPAAPNSPLAGLRARRDAAREQSFLDLRAPGYEPAVYVRFRALKPSEITRITNLHSKARPEDQPLAVNAALLAAACLGVFGLDEAGEPVGDPASWPRFSSPEFVAELGLDFGGEAPRAATVVREFYVDEIDVMAVGDKLASWSMKTDADLARDVPKG